MISSIMSHNIIGNIINAAVISDSANVASNTSVPSEIKTDTNANIMAATDILIPVWYTLFLILYSIFICTPFILGTPQ